MALAWIGCRTIKKPHRCALCGRDIKPGGPGSKVGTRWQKAYYCKQIDQWECMRCRGLGERCDRAADECTGCRHLVARVRLDGLWVHLWLPGHPGYPGTEPVAIPCSFDDGAVEARTEAA